MINTPTDFYKHLIETFPFQPTETQNLLLKKLSDFILSKSKNEVFILKGYAGTGKTTTISNIVSNLWRTGKKAILLAPTGRAAKVISNYAKKPAHTIHKKIYLPKKTKNAGVNFVRQVNKHRDTVFFVDEASMISNQNSNTKLKDASSLLDDLINYVYSGHGCKLILIGDTAQLPPVKLSISPALEADRLSFDFDKDVLELELNEVMRQNVNSGILVNATEIRYYLSGDSYNYTPIDFKFDISFPDIVRLQDGYDIEDAIHSAYNDKGIDDTVFIVRSNKRANQYNQQIRTKIRGQENEISTGDYIMVVKNNYYWLDDTSEAGFIANGDICEILAIGSIKELYGFRFAEVTIRMIDYKSQKPFEAVILLDTLTSETPSLSYEDSNRLYQEVAEDYADESSKFKQLLAIKNNKYFNALQVKFSYAITCHKSQGGQWNTVFLEQPYLSEGQNRDYLRWLYTAITRAKDKLYLIGFKDENFIQ